MNDILTNIQHRALWTALQDKDEVALKKLVDMGIGFDDTFEARFGTAIVNLVGNGYINLAIHALRTRRDMNVSNEIFKHFLYPRCRKEIELAIEVIHHPNAKPDTYIIEFLLLSGFPCPTDLTMHLAKNNTLITTAIDALTMRKVGCVKFTPKKVYRLRKIFYEFASTSPDCNKLFNLLPRTDKFLRFEFKLVKTLKLVIDHSSNKYIHYHYGLSGPVNLMADRQYAPDHIKPYAKILFLCNRDKEFPNEILYLILENLL